MKRPANTSSHWHTRAIPTLRGSLPARRSIHAPTSLLHNKIPDTDVRKEWWLMRFSTSETNTNLAIVNNTGGTRPVQDQNGSLRDGVTD